MHRILPAWLEDVPRRCHIEAGYAICGQQTRHATSCRSAAPECDDDRVAAEDADDDVGVGVSVDNGVCLYED